jgi:hypothetical protein
MHRDSCCRRALNFSHKTSLVPELCICFANGSGLVPAADSDPTRSRTNGS